MLRQVQTHEWLLLAASVVLTWRYGWLLDDAFVYFRYVDNWLFLGRGLVYNQGEYVEGFTSPMWTLLLAALRLSTLDYSTIVRGLSVTSAVAFWAASVAIHRRLAPPGPSLNLPLALMSTHYGVQAYFSSGIETPLVQLLALGFAALALWPRQRVLGVLVGLAPVLRHELAIPLVVYVVGLRLLTKEPPWVLLTTAIGSSGAWLCFRVYYYADLLPNTFYLKDGTDLSQGTRYLVNTFQAQWSWLAFSTLLGSLWYLARRRGGLRPSLELGARSLMLVAAASSVVYVVRVGGDMLYFRFLAFAFVLALTALGGVVERLPVVQRWPRRVFPLVAVAAAGLCSLGYPAQLSRHPLAIHSGEQGTMRKVHGISESSWHRHHPELRIDSKPDRGMLERYARAGQAARGQRRVVAEGWCAAGFHAFDSYVVHSWGLTEPILARARVAQERPGHKYRLLELASDLARARDVPLFERGPGVHLRAIVRGRAAPWLTGNLAGIELIEQKMYNHHDFWTNLGLAVTRVPPIVVPARPEQPRFGR